MTTPHLSRRLVLVAFVVFVSLGLSHGVVGVAWPSIRADFTRPLSDLGTLLAVGIAGYFLGGVGAGYLTERLGFGNLLTATTALGTVALLGHGLMTSWPLLLAASFGVGLTGGLIDSIVNAYVALRHGPRTMNLLHASFGIGATAGPLLVASALAQGLSWRVAYVILALAEAVLVVTVLAVRRRWPEAPHQAMSGPARLGLAVVGLLTLFLLYVGLEVAAGQWSYTLLTEARGVGAFAAGVWVALYWGGLTGGRLLLGVLGNRIPARVILHLSMAGSVIAVGFFWWNPVGWGAIALPLLGIALAGIFPTLVVLTPAWVGSDRSPTVIGYQIAASSVGAASLPWVAGQLMGETHLENLGPFLFVLAVAMAVLNYVVDKTTGEPAQRGLSRRLASLLTKETKSSQS